MPYLLVVGCWVLIAMTAAHAAPVRTLTDDGVIDWTARTVNAVGVGTPRILSPTGALTPREPYDVARVDAEKRIGRLLARLPVDDTRRLRDLDPLDGRRAAAAKAYIAAATRHFSDGTVHLPASAPFDWVAAEWPAPGASDGAGESPTIAAPLVVGPPLPGPSGLIVELDGPLEPCLRLRLSTPAGIGLDAGTAYDPLGATGVVYARDRGDVDLAAVVGAEPQVIKASPGPRRGAITLADEALVGQRIPGGVLVILPPEKP